MDDIGVGMTPFGNIVTVLSVVRPQSFDSWDGGSTDELKKTAVGKKIGKNLEKF